MSDPAKYRPDGELDEQKTTRDGLQLAEQRLQDEHDVSDDELKSWQDEAKQIAKDAYAYAEAGTDPDPAHLYDYTYAE